jgi:hypothetical protein
LVGVVGQFEHVVLVDHKPGGYLGL